jgi:crotonobetaine/carnitine-CoA ligase
MALVRPRFVVVDAARLGDVRSIVDALEDLIDVYVVGQLDEPGAMSGWASDGERDQPFARLVVDSKARAPIPAVQPRDLAVILFTSGTTGASKGVMIPHGHAHFFAEEQVHCMQLTDRDVYLAVGPMFHSTARRSLYSALLAGAGFAHSPFDAPSWLDTVRATGATAITVFGSMMESILDQPERNRDRDTGLRCVQAAPTLAPLADRFRPRFDVDFITEGFGSTEVCAPLLVPYGAVRPPGAVGMPVDEWFDVRLADPVTDADVGADVIGELRVRSKHPFPSPGYYAMPDVTERAFVDGEYRTGDALRRDTDGWYYVVDRIPDLIRTSDGYCSSREVEVVVLACEGIRECAAIGVPDPSGTPDQVMMIVVVLRDGAELTAEDLWSWCSTRLPARAQPRLIRFATEMPRTATLKVRKAALREIGVDASTFYRPAV